MEFIVGIAVWGVVFLIWYAKHYPDRIPGFQRIIPKYGLKDKSKRNTATATKAPEEPLEDSKLLVSKIQEICARDSFGSSDAATMIYAVRKLMHSDPAANQIWEAYALDSLEAAEIHCDSCRVPVEKVVRKTGVKIACPSCKKWVALKNSKVMIFDPSRSDLEEWEK